MDDSTNTLARSLHDLGAAAWFGGSLMGAVGVNRSAASEARAKDTADVAGAGWQAWTPVNLAAIAAHLAGGAVLTVANRKRLVGQRGVGAASAAKLAFTAAALGTTAYARLLGQRVIASEHAPAEDGTTPDEATPPVVADAQRKLAMLQWAIPLSTGGIIATSAVMGEQQRARQVAAGVVEKVADRFLPGS